MKNFKLQFLIMLFLSGLVFAQKNKATAQKEKIVAVVIEKDYPKADKRAYFPDMGDLGFRNKIISNLNVYNVNQYEGIKGEELKAYSEIKAKLKQGSEIIAEEKQILNRIDERDVVKSILTFVVDSDGKVINVETEGDNTSLNKEVERAVKSIDEKWKPAIRNNKAVKSKYRIPVSIRFE